MFIRKPRTHARLVHQTVTTVNGGPHVGRDHFRRTDNIGEPVALDPQRQARLTCELERCQRTYNLRVLSAKERSTIALRRLLVIMGVLVAGSLIAQLGTWLYDIGQNSQALRVLGGGMTGGGVVLNLLLLLWLLMTFWFWPPRYTLDPVSTADASPSPTSDVRPAHTVTLVSAPAAPRSSKLKAR